jgi:hypothetical protein
MFYGAEIAVCSQINKKKDMNTVSAECKFLDVKPVGTSRNRQALKG